MNRRVIDRERDFGRLPCGADAETVLKTRFKADADSLIAILNRAEKNNLLVVSAMRGKEVRSIRWAAHGCIRVEVLFGLRNLGTQSTGQGTLDFISEIHPFLRRQKGAKLDLPPIAGKRQIVLDLLILVELDPDA